MYVVLPESYSICKGCLCLKEVSHLSKTNRLLSAGRSQPGGVWDSFEVKKSFSVIAFYSSGSITRSSGATRDLRPWHVLGLPLHSH